MSYCLVCLASGTKDPCVRCGHRPSKRVEQLVHLRLKSIYKAFKQSGASVGPSDSSSRSSGGGSSGTVACNHASSAGNNKAGRDASTIGGKYSSTLRSLADNDSAGTQHSDSKDNIGAAFDQSMANEVAAVLQTASNAMASNVDGDTADSRRSKGKRVSSHSSSHDGGSGRNRPRSNSASAQYYRKTQAELEAAAAAAEADAEAAAAALLAELDEEDASAISKKKKKKKKKEKKKDSASEPEQPNSNTTAGKVASLPSQKKRADKKTPATKKSSKESDDDSSDDEINFEQLVGRTKGSTKALKKKDRKEVDLDERDTAVPVASNPNAADTAPPIETSTDFDKELAILLSNDDEQGLENFLDKLRGVPGLGAARKTAKKALKRIKEAKEPVLFEEDEPLFENKTGVTIVENERKSSKPSSNKSASLGQSSRSKHSASTAGTNPTNTSPSVKQEPLLRVVSRTPSNSASSSTRGGSSNPTSTSSSARGECVMHMSPLLVGWVIGKGGQRIRDMMEESGAKIWIDQESMSADEARVVYVSGKRSSVDAAVKMVKDLVAKAPIAANTAQTPPPNKLNSASDEIAAATSTENTDSAEEPPSFAAAIASAPSISAPATKPVVTQDAVSKRGWAASQTQNVSASLAKSPTIAIPSQANTLMQAPAASITPQLSDNVRKEFTCHANFISQLVAAGTINLIQAESGANVLVDQSGASPKIIVHGKSANVNKAEQFLRNAINTQARQNTLEVASNHQNFGSVDANAVVNLTQGFQGASLSSYQEQARTGGISSQSIPPGYAQPSQPSSLGSFSDSQPLSQQPLLNSKPLSSGSVPHESWARQNRSILPQFPPHAGVSNASNPHQLSAFGLAVDLNQSSYNALAQSSSQSHHGLPPERVQGASISGLSNSNFGDSWNSRGDNNFPSTQRNMQFDAPLFTESQTAPGTGTLGGIPFGQNSNDDSQMVDNMFASLGGIGGGLLSNLNSTSQQTWGSLNNWVDNAAESQQRMEPLPQQFSRLDSSLDSSQHEDERRIFGN
eukprot:scaffold4034_cov142-Skeletonema_menzelii.AAC.6